MAQHSNADLNNIVLIVIDALRADRVGAYSNNDLTPNIDALAEEGELFENCFACINTTDPSVTTILTGQYPTRHGVLNHGERVTEEEMNRVAGTTPIPDLLDDRFHTIGVDSLMRWHSRGFDDYSNPKSASRSSAINMLAKLKNRFPSKLSELSNTLYSKFFIDRLELSDSIIITNLATEAIEESEKNFFSFIHYWDPHIPYNDSDSRPAVIESRKYNDDRIVEELLNDISGSPWEQRLRNGLLGDVQTVGDVKRNYDTGVVQADQQVGRVVEFLKSQGVYDETAIVVTADHGESFTEHGILFDHHGLYEVTTHVPLIIKAPGFRGRESEVVQHFDLAPTILDLVGQTYSADRFDGDSLVPLKGERELDRNGAFSEEAHTNRRRSIQTDSHRYILNIDGDTTCRYCETEHAPAVELYDIRDDPEEFENIESELPDVCDELETQLEEFINSLPDPARDGQTYEVSDEVKNHLEEMGYV